MVKKSNNQAIVLLSNPMTFDIRPMMTARSLEQNGYDVTALCWDREGQNPAIEKLSPSFKINRFGLKSTYSQKSSKLFGFLFFYVWCIFKSFSVKAKIIYCNDIDMLPLGLLIKCSKLSRVRLIYDMHDHPHIFVYRMPFSKLFENLLLLVAKRYADHVIVVNDAFTKYLSNIGFDSAKITCIMNVSPIGSCPLNTRHVVTSELTIFYYGSITRERGVDKLCDIVEDLANVTLILAGRGDLEGYISTLSTHQKNIKYIGWINQKEIDRIIAEETDVIAILTDRFYVQTPLTHTLASPRKLFTGMAKGIPVLVSEGAYMSQVVEIYNCGIVLDFKNLAESKKAVEYLRDNPDFRRKLGENGFNAALNSFNWSLMEKRLEGLWFKIANE